MRIIILLITILILDLLIPFTISWKYPNYSQKKMALSVLGARQSPVKAIYNPWCIISGVSISILFQEIYETFSNGLMLAIWIIIIIYAVTCEVISAFCPLNENREETDILTKIHGATSALGFSLLLFVPLLIGIYLLNNTYFVTGLIAIVSFIVAFIFFAFFIMGEKEKFKNTVLSYSGLWQRLIMFLCYIALIALGIQAILI